ncbi:transketolase [Entomoplasma freundtii]|uniref:Transketolase n=1 Tax=Entomoplasma freundtii TaxID=74700 RepID=A0A2K8NR94_9MOLU|nr:transketolase [Entomoplasma freundtii]ATZ16352.1 transketolase [Entomoplasma freundtii]TDY56609.1 transketolase [Entomoplasma freundtii]
MTKKDDSLHLNAMRILGVEAINKANSGHPGIVLGAAPMVFTLFTKIMAIDPQHSQWFNRDRFVLSAGHGSALLYSALHLSGFDLPMDELKRFRQWGSLTPGHPERGLTDGVEVTTGPLGQGIAMGVGMALGEKFLGHRFNKPNFPLINHYTFVLCGDGDLQEGISQEAITFAAKQELHKLILLHDSNDIQLDDKVSEATIENHQKRFEAAGWNVLEINDGEDLEALEAALNQAKKASKPTYIEVKTIIGRGATKEGTNQVHGNPLGTDLAIVKQRYQWDHPDFVIPQETYDFYKENVNHRGAKTYHEWEEMRQVYAKEFPNDYQELEKALNHNWEMNVEALLAATPVQKQATRISSGLVFNQLAQENPTLFGGSADLASSTKIKGPNGNYGPNNRDGRNVIYGVREFAMGAINNGMAAHGGILPVGSGFFVFSDYLKPAMRLASLMKLQNLFIFTHDSIAVGEDGPTHEPIEQLAMVRSIPMHNVFRPADYAETVGAYHYALKDKHHPSTIILTRQDLAQQKHHNVIAEVAKGAYILADQQNPEVTLIATGSEVELAVAIQQALLQNNVSSRVVSMPSMNLFEQQPLTYRQQVIDPKTFRVSLEMGTTYGWGKYVGDEGISFGIDEFGASAPGDEVIAKYGFTADKIVPQILKKLKEKK